jgi:hypothetical protein
MESGKSLAQVAQSKNISQATLVDKLVAAEKTRSAAAVNAGQLTQAQADSMTADLTTRITERVTNARPMGGRGHHRGDGYRGGTGPAPSAPGTSPSTSATSTTRRFLQGNAGCGCLPLISGAVLIGFRQSEAGDS